MNFVKYFIYDNDNNLNCNDNIIINSYDIKYLYNELELIGFLYNNQIYYYEKNISGDIISIYRVIYINSNQLIKELVIRF